MSRQEWRGSAREYQADEQAGVVRLRWGYQADEQAGVEGGQLDIMKQMSRQEYRGSAGDYQADEQAGVAGLSWRVSGR